MPVSKTFGKSKLNQIINFILFKYGKEDNYQEIIDEALSRNLIKTAKEPGTNKTSDKPNKSGITRWTAFQQWVKIWQIIEGYKLNRNEIKEFWGSEFITQTEWVSVAAELDQGVDIRSCDKPNITQPWIDYQANIKKIEKEYKQEKVQEEKISTDVRDESGILTDVEEEPEKVEEEPEKVQEEPEKVQEEDFKSQIMEELFGTSEEPEKETEKSTDVVEEVEDKVAEEDEFNRIDTNGDGVIDREEMAAYKEKEKAKHKAKLQAELAALG